MKRKHSIGKTKFAPSEHLKKMADAVVDFDAYAYACACDCVSSENQALGVHAKLWVIQPLDELG